MDDSFFDDLANGMMSDEFGAPPEIRLFLEMMGDVAKYSSENSSDIAASLEKYCTFLEIRPDNTEERTPEQGAMFIQMLIDLLQAVSKEKMLELLEKYKLMLLFDSNNS